MLPSPSAWYSQSSHTFLCQSVPTERAVSSGYPREPAQGRLMVCRRRRRGQGTGNGAHKAATLQVAGPALVLRGRRGGRANTTPGDFRSSRRPSAPPRSPDPAASPSSRRRETVHPRGRPTSWRNGSASDSKSEGCVFKSHRGQRSLSQSSGSFYLLSLFATLLRSHPELEKKRFT